jgi:DHA1 family bicyclomycin/chloramphenicol resistance-like MFS transporter
MVLTHREALSYISSQCFAMGAMFAFITGSPLVYMTYFGVSKTLYPILFGANVLGMIAANRLNVRLLHHFTPQQILWFGQCFQITLGVLMVAYVGLFVTLSLSIIVTGMILFIGAMGLIVSNATSSTIEFFPHNAATATAILGAFGFATGSISGSLVGILGDGSPWPMIFVMCLCAILGLLFRQFLHRNTNRSTA